MGCGIERNYLIRWYFSAKRLRVCATYAEVNAFEAHAEPEPLESIPTAELTEGDSVTQQPAVLVIAAGGFIGHHLTRYRQDHQEAPRPDQAPGRPRPQRRPYPDAVGARLETYVRLQDGLAGTYAWIKKQLERRVQQPVAGGP
jgi:hypothetical protein